MTRGKIDIWRDNFKAATLRTSFVLSLSRPMLEFLCAAADGVSWDRATHGSTQAYPDSFIATARSLEKRGLVVHVGEQECRRRRDDRDAGMLHDEQRSRLDFYTWSAYRLTPAGEKVVELLKIAGLFIEADAAIHKKARAVKQ